MKMQRWEEIARKIIDEQDSTKLTELAEQLCTEIDKFRRQPISSTSGSGAGTYSSYPSQKSSRSGV
jgi:hypothetical protein